MRAAIHLATTTALLGLATACGPIGMQRYDLMIDDDGSLPTSGAGAAPTLCEQEQDGLSLCINEAMSRNHSLVADPYGGFSDWIELYNAGSEPIELSRIVISDEGSAPARLQGRTLNPTETVLLWADGREEEGHLPFKLDGDGERVTVLLDERVADVLELPELASDQVLTRWPDGGVVELGCDASPGLRNLTRLPCEDPTEEAFALGAVHEFHLTLDDADWATLESSSTFEHPKVEATLGFPEGEFTSVSVNIKGGYGSFRNDLDADKVAFKIDLNAYEDHQWRGLEKLTLNNMVQDPTWSHEYLTYWVYREVGLPAPRVSYAELYVNGTYFGLYAFVESVDDTFLERWYDDPDGHLFEGAYGDDLYDVGDEAGFDYDEGPHEEAGRAELLALIEVLDQPWDEATFADLQQLVDMDQFATNMAIEAALWHWDGYYTSNNYRIYQDPTTGLWQIIPHGSDQTWVDGYPNPYDVSAGNGALHEFCMAVPSCTDLYAEKLLEVADVLEGMPLEERLDLLLAVTDPYLASEPRDSASGRDSEIASTRARMQEVVQALRDAAQ